MEDKNCRQDMFRWLNAPTGAALPITFGVPWGRGELQRTDKISVEGKNGPVAAQIKPIAYWPEGTVKWTAVSAVIDADETLKVQKIPDAQKASEAAAAPIAAAEGDVIRVDTGRIVGTFCTGTTPICGMGRKGMGGTDGHLYAYLQRREENDACETERTWRLTGRVDQIKLEEDGPIRAVIRMDGVHLAPENAPFGKADFFPFTLRLYFYAGSDEVRMVHSFGVDVDQDLDLLKGVCVELDIPAAGAFYNRHVGFAGEDGMFYEGVQNMFRGGGQWKRTNVNVSTTSPEECLKFYETQVQEGQFVYLDPQKNDDFAGIVSDNAVWTRFLLRQRTSDSYTLAKQTATGLAQVPAAAGGRSNGAMFFGSEACIVSAAIKEIWQKAPRALEIDHAGSDVASMKLWLYSKYEDAFSFGVYDRVAHNRSYEVPLNEPTGVANTNEMFLRFYDAMPGKKVLFDFAQDAQMDRLVIAEDPARYQDTRVFGGYWTTQVDPEKTDANLLALGQFFADEIERRRWYGFWDYGDVCHSYDKQRHTWKYDIGGYAWNNTELCNTYAYWLAFLRTQDPKIYRLASAMSRHASEVDLYHFGPFAGMGSRHHVRHWGDGSKEPRMSLAGHHRFYYYLTCDERMGDVFDLVHDQVLDTYCKEAKHENPEDRFAHVHMGPTWTGFVSDWMTAWERHENTKSRDMILRGIQTIAQAPMRMVSGAIFHFDPTDGSLYYYGDPTVTGHTHSPADGNYQQSMVIMFGAPEILMELDEWLGDGLIRSMLVEYGEYAARSDAERIKAAGGLYDEETVLAWSWSKGDCVAENGGDFTRFHAIAALYGNHPELWRVPENVINGRTEDENGGKVISKFLFENLDRAKKVEGPDVYRSMLEVEDLTAPQSAQAVLNYLEASHLLYERDHKG